MAEPTTCPNCAKLQADLDADRLALAWANEQIGHLQAMLDSHQDALAEAHALLSQRDAGVPV